MKSLIMSLVLSLAFCCYIVYADFPADNLVAYYSFSTNLTMDDLTGAGTLINHNVYHDSMNGKNGYSSKFNESLSTYLETLNSGAIGDLDNTYSVNLWVKPLSGDGVQRYIINSYWSGGLEYDFSMFIHTSNQFVVSCDGGYGALFSSGLVISNETWHMLTLKRNGTKCYGYLNGSILGTGNYTVNEVYTNKPKRPLIGYRRDGAERYWYGHIDEIGMWNEVLSDYQISVLYNYGIGSFFGQSANFGYNVAGLVNLTSDYGQQCGWNSTKYSLCGPTEDGTPTFRFNTTGNATCKIWNDAKGWTYLDSIGVSDCATTGTNFHICTMSQPLQNGTQLVYFACKSSLGEVMDYNTFKSNSANITITSPMHSSQTLANEAMEIGIKSSSIWPGALIYTNQPIYIRTKNNNQAFGIFDKLAIYGNQRWGFSYIVDNDSSINSNNAFYNISPIFFYLEMANISYHNAVYQVAEFINSTKQN